ncbi:MAG: LysM peptidoglycan-binding domain-containing protein [Planctomycetes bacterium]|nr:LysM peptidoglycan-binding domain-containing protein [Planctomycetota bacterium]MCB9904880.1 LysM peptidoglycan-binding domain-containing protein [Planctomycetota bacterium]
MQRIERYGVLALVFLLVTLVTFALWDGDSKPADEKVAKAGPAKEAPARQLTPAERQQREALRRREEAKRAEELHRSQQAAKAKSLEEKYATGKSAAELAKQTQTGAPGVGFVTTDRPVVDGPAVRPAGLQIGIVPTQDPANFRPTPAADLPATNRPEPTPGSGRDNLSKMDKHRRQREHVVARGETLSQISMEQLGTTRRMQEIVALNPGLDPDHLYVGQKLMLPGADAATESLAARTPSSKPAVPSGPGGTYTIQSGDVLSRIAQDQLGSVKQVSAILALNPGLDPNRMSVGQVIAMPAGARVTTTTEVASASRNSSSNRASADRPRVR